MKDLFKKFLLSILTALAKIKLKKLKCKVICVTGSVGKTTCKDAIYHILKEQYSVLKSEKSYNSEFGVPLTILRQKSGFSSPLAWFKILCSAFRNAFFAEDQYDFVVLEMGVDKPGDMDVLTKMVKPDYAIVTSIKHVHMSDGQFDDLNEVFLEKTKLFEHMKKDGVAFINLDDDRLAPLFVPNNPQYISYSQHQNADIQATNITHSSKGISFDVHLKKERFEITIPVLGEYHVSTLLPAIAVALKIRISPEKIKLALQSFTLPPGRMSLIKGIFDITILDSTYNASPHAVSEALKILDVIGKEKKARRVFVFGNMNELGKYSEKAHREIGKKIPEYADVLITVGEDAKKAADEVRDKISDENIIVCDNALEAAKRYKSILQKDDVILAKGSQNKVRLELFVKDVMAHPEKARKLLVRQSKGWEKISA